MKPGRDNAQDPFERTVARFIDDRRLFDAGATLCVALSGGRDSVAALSVLVALAPTRGWRIRARHVRHGLRDDSADALCCQQLCRRLNVPLEVSLLSAEDLNDGEGVQARARLGRYRALLKDAPPTSFLITAHHADDALETSLIRWTRGAGLEGVAGIPLRGRWPNSDVIIARPLLQMTRDEITDYVSRLELPFCEDPTNPTDKYLRNRIRHDVIPTLAAAATRPILAPMRRTVANLRRDAVALSALADSVVRLGVTHTEEPAAYLPLQHVTSLADAATAQVLRHMSRHVVAGHTPSAKAVEETLRRLRGDRRPWRDGRVTMGREGRFLVVRAEEATTEEAPTRWRLGDELAPSSVRAVGPLTLHLCRWLRGDGPTSRPPDACAEVLYLDLDAVDGALEMRPPKRGEKLTIQHRDQQIRRPISELLRERGVPPRLRNIHPVLTDNKGPLWIPGVARSSAGRVHENSHRVLRVALMSSPWYLCAR